MVMKIPFLRTFAKSGRSATKTQILHGVLKGASSGMKSAFERSDIKGVIARALKGDERDKASFLNLLLTSALAASEVLEYVDLAGKDELSEEDHEQIESLLRVANQNLRALGAPADVDNHVIGDDTSAKDVGQITLHYTLVDEAILMLNTAARTLGSLEAVDSLRRVVHMDSDLYILAMEQARKRYEERGYLQ